MGLYGNIAHTSHSCQKQSHHAPKILVHNYAIRELCLTLQIFDMLKIMPA